MIIKGKKLNCYQILIMPAKYFFLLICLLFSNNGIAQSTTLGSKSVAMGGTGITFNDIHALLNNPAGLAHLKSISGLLATEQRFVIKDLHSIAAGFALPTAHGSLGMSLQYFGFDLYNEQRFAVAYARPLLDNFSIGAQILFYITPKSKNMGINGQSLLTWALFIILQRQYLWEYIFLIQ